MTVYSSAVYLQLFLKLNFCFFSFTTLVISALYYYMSYKTPSVKLVNNTTNLLFKFCNIICYGVFFIFFLISFFFFFKLAEEFKLSTINTTTVVAYT